MKTEAMEEYLEALTAFIYASKKVLKGRDSGIDLIYVHPEIFHELIKIGQTISIHIEFDAYHRIKRILFRGIEIRQGRETLPNPIMY